MRDVRPGGLMTFSSPSMCSLPNRCLPACPGWSEGHLATATHANTVSTTISAIHIHGETLRRCVLELYREVIILITMRLM